VVGVDLPIYILVGKQFLCFRGGAGVSGGGIQFLRLIIIEKNLLPLMGGNKPKREIKSRKLNLLLESFDLWKCDKLKSTTKGG